MRFMENPYAIELGVFGQRVHSKHIALRLRAAYQRSRILIAWHYHSLRIGLPNAANSLSCRITQKAVCEILLHEFATSGKAGGLASRHAAHFLPLCLFWISKLRL